MGVKRKSIAKGDEKGWVIRFRWHNDGKRQSKGRPHEASIALAGRRELRKSQMEKRERNQVEFGRRSKARKRVSEKGE